jgi:RNA polymerase sigma factor (sigma-70 family)
VDEALLRALTPTVIGILGRRGADFAAAEDAVQDALVEATRVWPTDPPRDPKAWLVTVAWRRFLDATRADASRRRHEELVDDEPPPGPAEGVDDSLRLYFLCAHPSLSPTSAVALTLRAVGGLTTRQIAQAYLVPEATMAQRISRAKRTVADVRFDEPGDVSTVLRVLYLVSTRATSATSTSPPRRSASPGNSQHGSTIRRSTACWRSCCSTTRGDRRGLDPTAASFPWPSRNGGAGTRR